MLHLVGYMLLFLVIAIVFVAFHLLIGRFVRPNRPDAEKMTIYECGEPTIGSAWIQFDLRYYVVALLFVIFDVEVAFFFPWAVVFGEANAVSHAAASSPEQVAQARKALEPVLGAFDPQEPVSAGQQREAGRFAWLALADIGVFFGVLLVGFAYLWRRGDIDWVRSVAAEKAAEAGPPAPAVSPNGAGVLVGSGQSH